MFIAPAAVYAGAYIAGSLGGVALGTAIVQKVMPRQQSSHNTSPSTHFDLSKELNRLGMKNPF